MELLVNGVVAVLLLVTICVATVLYVRLGRIRKIRGEMEGLIQQLGLAGSSAETSLRGFREMAEGTGRELEAQVSSGRGLRDELTFLIDRAATIADRLAAVQVPQNRTAPETAPASAGVAQAPRAAKLVQAIRPRGRAAGEAGARRDGVAPDADILHRSNDAEQALMRALESAR